MPGLYIHVPFCVRKCRYCDFYSVPSRQDLQDSYLDALELELSRLPRDFKPDTVFVGGGTPTVLDAVRLGRLLELIGRAAAPAEWTVEANPGTLDRDKAVLLKRAGVNRVSLGIQSFDPANLSLLGRIHTAEQAVAAFALLRETGFENISVDLMYAIPGVVRGVLERDLRHVTELKPEHVACYALIFEEGTELTRLRDAGEIREVGDDEQLSRYRLVRHSLGDAGLRHYEISNFARKGFECRHNLLYWSGGEYIGCGPAAHSHRGGVRWANVRDVRRYCEALGAGKPARDFEEKLEPEAKARETLVMSLRRLDGVSRDEFRARTGFDYRALRGREIGKLVALGMLEDDGTRLRLTEKGLFVSDSVFAELV
ncbi:MAG: Oxygen-independent coproporphyrinogen-III oxidase 1 [Verrucomicrobia bacterium ADurb.Bin345]|nr:MAG: Oxygen-independent coproporphyrinogen-III oxidase 1 [Verrucomicrobia bacterium ADurb.Bin345]